MKRLSRRAISSGLTLLAVLVLLYETANGCYEAIEPAASTREPLAVSLADKPAVQPSSAYEILEERPLLSPTRRPRPPKAQATPTAAVPQPLPVPAAPTLLGTIISPERRVALVKVDNGPTVTVAEGGHVAGWTLDQVQPSEAMFRMDARVVPVKLSWNAARQSAAASSRVADASTMPMRARGGLLVKP